MQPYLGSLLRTVAERAHFRGGNEYGEIECPFCGERSRNFGPAGLDIPVLKERHVVGAGYRPYAVCPRCHSLDRERLIYLYLMKKTKVFRRNLTLLHVAPERNLQHVLAARENIDYHSVDISSTSADASMDIMYLGYRAGSFDVVICNHVLEHVSDDKKAMSELRRVLKPGGWAILQVPISLSLDQTYENPLIVAPGDRERLFGQSDHVRIYGKDYRDRLEQTGFLVRVQSSKREFGESACRRYGLIRDENLYVCHKPL
jgi:SAM-dependent methyltransferase